MTVAFEPVDPDNIPQKEISPTLRRRVGSAFDFIVESDGCTIEELASQLRCSVHNARQVVHHIRHAFRGEKVNLVCSPNGHRQPWVYKFVSTQQESKAWISNRTNDSTTRLETIRDVNHSIALAEGKRTLAGKRAHKIDSTLTYLLNELSELTA